MECPDFIRKIDWELLREQKQTIIDISEMSCFTEKDYWNFEGLLSLLDAIQDYAVDECEMNEIDVFGDGEDNKR